MQSTQHINTQMLALAREARGFSQAELADKISTSQANINRWESAAIEINPESFQAIVKVLGFPVSFFQQQQEILLPTFYRKRDKVAKRILDKIDANVNICRLQISSLMKATGHIITPILQRTGSETPQEMAQLLRKKWRVSKGPIDNLTALLEQQGIAVLPYDFETDRVDSHSIITEGKNPVICVNNNLLGDRLRFTLAHELGYLVLHAFTAPRFDVDASHEANLFAAELLMPEKDIIPDFQNGVTMQTLADLKTKWKVSMQALLYRAEDLQLLSYNQKRYLLTQFNALKIRRREPPQLDIPVEKPILLRNLLTKYRTRQKMSVKDMATFFNLNEKEFEHRYANI
jgi:Zn-dependent peptidase ImmA (M78 family)/transcriptional regulator with XRE-family HTH domain